MSDLLSTSIQDWIDSYLEKVSVYNPVAIHIDQLLGRNFSREEWIRISIEAFGMLVEQLRTLQTPVQPALSIPLVSTSNRLLQLTIPNDIREVENQMGMYDRPSLFMLDWERRSHLLIGELYQRPLFFDLPISSIQGIYVYYSEFRDRLSLTEGDEFIRRIGVDYYPDRYRNDLR